MTTQVTAGVLSCLRVAGIVPAKKNKITKKWLNKKTYGQIICRKDQPIHQIWELDESWMKF